MVDSVGREEAMVDGEASPSEPYILTGGFVKIALVGWKIYFLPKKFREG